MSHTCHWPGCTVEVDPKMWGCRRHWFMLPRSEQYIAAAQAARNWILENHQT